MVLCKVYSSHYSAYLILIFYYFFRSDHPETTSLLQRVQGQVNAYYIALDSSIDIAEQGHTFALDCYDLCDFFLDPDNSAEDITDYISLMREKAQVGSPLNSPTSCDKPCTIRLLWQLRKK